MPLSDFELHRDRLTTSDENGRRIFLYPADVRGFFRRRRTQVQYLLILFFLLLPWLKIRGRQSLLLNIAERKFEVFGLSLRAHNSPLLLLVFSTAAFGLFFATTVFGRIWCGWACPQTVFIDGVFRKIERWIEGSAPERRALQKSQKSFKKFFKKTAKWILFLVATLTMTHSFLAYFVGTDQLAAMMQESPSKNQGTFLFMLVSTAIILFDFAWFREQFCTLVCPYGRLQSVLMDKNSMVVAYDQRRGEPRATQNAKALAKAQAAPQGDCVNCYRCVQVCPTGIDIRRGLQMECIACTSCVDACDEVMTRIKKPIGLIRYDSMLQPGQKKEYFNARSSLYLALCIFSFFTLLVLLSRLKTVDVQVLRAKDAPYTRQVNADASLSVVNHFKIDLSNQSGTEHKLIFKIKRSGNDPELHVITAFEPLEVADGKVMQADIFIQFPESILVRGQKKIFMLIRDERENLSSEPVFEIQKEVTLVGPFS
jgi:cytochrome c oxidase accessory protein FixG